MNSPEVHSEVKVVNTIDLDTAIVPDPRRSLAVHCCGATDKGQVRPNNEDQFLVAQLSKALRVLKTSLPQSKTRHSSDCSHLFIVADGMGGHAAGEQASALAIDSVETYVLEALKWFAHKHGDDDDQLLAEFRQALGLAHERVRHEAVEHPELHGMGTTLTLAYSLNDQLFVAHVGDSRCYLFRERILFSVTQDHTLVEEMVRKGMLTPEEAVTHRWRHVITSTVGGESEKVRIDVHRLHLQPGDVVLLCSDGLTEMQNGDQIAAILQNVTDPEAACQRLIAAANEAGGKDNITVVVAAFSEAECEG
ncbi:Stp1/IreP family PP2C-type Ser/Thr phosphatase [Anatilimnocola floriformis]|uniref:Stp1/IreP family PP2C-type Ser/Thr phosphatase n=1 Tax=Anatilimnocola floriformis TaxID=2948575 RepID=UPI0020C4FA99|nr:Stp1/IreP family PP2C-type Ser/Thr phosphatase [Anatilimnocola floriformis]